MTLKILAILSCLTTPKPAQSCNSSKIKTQIKQLLYGLPLPFLQENIIPARCCSLEAQSNAGGTAITLSWVTAQRAVKLLRLAYWGFDKECA